MKKKEIIKLNENDNHLSLGNIFRIIKSISINPNSFLQSDLFCIIFNCEFIGTSTVNNYCTGYRGINPDYKNYMLKKKELYQIDKNIFIPILSKIINLLNNGKFTSNNYTIEEINNNNKLKFICSKLYTISKNDSDVNFSLSTKLLNYINDNDYYNFFIETLFFTVLDKEQPKYKKNTITEAIENNLSNTNISVKDVESFMQLQLNSGIWSIRGLNELTKEKNPFACFEMASLEFYGIISGKPRYYKAYEYYKIASDNNHPVALWAIGYLFYNGYIGTQSNDDLIKAYEYFLKSKDLKCSNAYNSLGLTYLNGNIPNINKNKKMALDLFKQSANLGNVYAYNNLGKIAEQDKEYKVAYEYYLISANLGDSWALNKLGEFYRKGIYVEKDLNKAYNYYLKSSKCPKLSLCNWSKYNLAKYFYKNGNHTINLEPNIEKSIELLKDICNDLIEANEELIYIYYDLYITNNKNENDLEKLKYYINLIEQKKSYNNDIKEKIETNISKIKIQNININKFI